ncbi:hypothetical protein MKX03_028215 [Papaver bracteatum]|nr:hypothetical protein MKX03_028215 [Papaver bracteatum]
MIMGQEEYGQENSEFDHGEEVVVPVGKEKDEEMEVEVEVDNLIRINSKKQQQQQIEVGENDILNMVAAAVHVGELVLPKLNTNVAKEDENPELEEEDEDEHSLPSSSSDQKSVYFDEIRGIWKCRHCTWTYRMESCSSKIDQHIQNPKGHCHRTMDMETLRRQEYCFDLESKGAVSTGNGTNRTNEIGSPSAELSTAVDAPTKDDLEVPNAEKSLVNGTNLHVTRINEVEQTGLHVESPLENEYSDVKLVGNKHVQFGEFEESITEEVIEWDVERVIEEQETHDLICPNCKACITKRVILLKRKRSVPITEDTREPPKKFGTPARSNLKPDPSTSSSNSQDHYAGVIPGAPDTNERRNDVFQCFSCFSFFIPTVAGFRLFRCFGFDDEESLSMSQPTPSPNQGILLPKEVKLVGEVTPDGKRTADSDDKNESIPSLSTTFPFLEPAHWNGQVKDVIGKIEVEEQNVIVPPLQGATTMEEILRDTTESHKNGRKETDGGKYSNTPKEVDGKGILTLSEKDALLLRDRRDGTGGAESVPIKNIAGGNVILDILDAPIGSGYSSVQLNIVPAAPFVPPARGTESLANEQGIVTATRSREWDILKSIVYGGLVEAIMSLGVVSSAAGADATTLNIVALGMASLVSGLLVIIHGDIDFCMLS